LDAHDERTQVAKLKLQRLDVCALVSGDELLSRSPLVARLTADGARDLLGTAQLKRYAAGAEVFHEGAPGACVYLVTRGEVELAVGKGPPIAVATVCKGDHFGEEMLWGGHRGFTATALTELEVAEIPRDPLIGAAKSHPPLVDELTRTAAERKKAREELDAFVNRW
jgi:CRP-like cAMP-binding protein